MNAYSTDYLNSLSHRLDVGPVKFGIKAGHWSRELSQNMESSGEGDGLYAFSKKIDRSTGHGFLVIEEVPDGFKMTTVTTCQPGVIQNRWTTFFRRELRPVGAVE